MSSDGSFTSLTLHYHQHHQQLHRLAPQELFLGYKWAATQIGFVSLYNGSNNASV